MSPEYLRELADFVDLDKLWRMAGMDRHKLSPEQRKQDQQRAYEQGKSLVLTTLGPSGYTRSILPTPAEHQRLRDLRTDAIKKDATP